MKASKLSNEIAEDEAFKVFVRVRPLMSREKYSGSSKTNGSIVKVVEESKDSTKLYLSDPEMVYDYVGRRQRGYDFDTIFQESDTNESVFERTVLPLLPSILEGYNATCFAYGMTGSGKTHTMLGDIYS
jgi:hypothetical protein